MAPSCPLTVTRFLWLTGNEVDRLEGEIDIRTERLHHTHRDTHTCTCACTGTHACVHTGTESQVPLRGVSTNTWTAGGDLFQVKF
jgi:hypothetical protein